MRLEAARSTFQDAMVLDAGCGEGKNAVHLARLGAHVDAVDVSELALANAQQTWGQVVGIDWHCANILDWDTRQANYDIVVAYGLLHCLESRSDIQSLVHRLKSATAVGGQHVLCTFNDRFQDLSAHPGLNPCLIGHAEYLEMYSDWSIDFESDLDLVETHPHNRLSHTHSMTRLIARKRS